jgi:hypothetical protein
LPPAIALSQIQGVSLHRDAVWRLARGQGVNIDRQRRRHIAWPVAVDGTWANVCGVAAGPNVSVVFAGPVRDNQWPIGTWLYPQLEALTPAAMFGARLDWTAALEAMVRSEIHPNKHRAVQERRGLLLERVMSKVKALPVLDVAVGGDPLSAEFLHWLVALRAVQSDLGKRGPELRVRCAASFTSWKSLLCDVLGASPDRTQVGSGEDERVVELLWRPRVHFWWHSGSPSP